MYLYLLARDREAGMNCGVSLAAQCRMSHRVRQRKCVVSCGYCRGDIVHTGPGGRSHLAPKEIGLASWEVLHPEILPLWSCNIGTRGPTCSSVGARRIHAMALDNALLPKDKNIPSHCSTSCSSPSRMVWTE